MPRAARVRAALAALACVGSAFAPAVVAAEPVRAAPTRPGASPAPAAVPTTRIDGIDHVNLADAAKLLALRPSWLEPGRKLLLADAVHRVVLEAESRDTMMDGLRVFLGRPARARGGELFVSRVDFERCLAPIVRPALGVAVPPPPKTICLDPGHGGRDEGAENPRFRLKEKILTLDVALRLKKLLEAAGYRVVLTRSDDRALADRKDTDLALRAAVANAARADLFISIHFNAALKNTRGTEVFTFAPRTQRSSVSWGRDGTDDGEADNAPVNRHDFWSNTLAAALHRAQLAGLKTEDRGKKIAHWAVLRPLDCPGVLVEPAIITNDTEARRVATPEFRQQIAESLAAGVRAYAATLDALRPAGAPVAPAPTK
ncbi:MAG: hypothetical protein RLZZ15_370 [Verrucomicrobiota bacterium]|jgi:N-acetylmuramoyl-L-alanine amidase